MIRVLELFQINPEDDSETNMSLRYQKYKCLLPPLEDPIGVVDIINEVIDSLDLERRRYKLPNTENNNSDIERIELIDDDNHVTYVPINRIKSESNIKLIRRPQTYKPCFTNVNRISLPYEINESHINILERIFDQVLTENSSEEVINDKPKLIKNSSLTTIMFNKKFNTTISYADIHTSTLQKRNSPTNNVKYLINQLLDHLKLEESYEISDPSSECCDKEHTIYFLNKSGTLNDQEKELCTVYLPPVKTGKLFKYFQFHFRY